jgi:nitrate/nitrite-specific signal transduction histidine kinase
MQIIINLLSNAREALKESNNAPKTITVGLKKKGDNRILVEVADNGIGIPKENRNKVFELGFTTKKKRTWLWPAHRCHTCYGDGGKTRFLQRRPGERGCVYLGASASVKV